MSEEEIIALLHKFERVLGIDNTEIEGINDDNDDYSKIADEIIYQFSLQENI